MAPNQSMDERPQGRNDIIFKAKTLNRELELMDREISELVETINKPDIDNGASFLSQNILNNYFDALQSIEVQTVKKS